MKSMVKGLLTAVLMAAFAPTAQADVEKPLWQCGLHFTATGSEIIVFVGHSKLQGQGLLSCVDVAGNTEQIPVTVTMKAPILFPRIAIAPKITVEGLATGIGVATSPEALFGRYYAVDARVSVGAGLGAVLALHGRQNGVTFNMGIEGSRGFGFGAGMTIVTIAPYNPQAN